MSTKQGVPKSIFRSNKTGKSRYTSIFNSVLQNETLSLKERGLLVYLLSLDENWVINKTFLVSKSEDGRESVFSAFDGLVKKGYIVEVPRERQKDGRFKAVNYIVHEEPNIEFDQNDYPDKNEALDKFQKQTNDFMEKSVENNGILTQESSTNGFSASGKPVTGKPLTDNPHIESNIIEKNLINLSDKVDLFISTFINNSKDLESVRVPASVPERNSVAPEPEIDCFANSDDLSEDFVPSGIEPSKKPFVAPQREKTYKYPPFQPNSPANIKNLFEEHVDTGRVDIFEYQYFEFIAWREIKSDKMERPWNPSEINIDFLNETCKSHIPVKKYVGVQAYRTGQYVKKEYHYINLFNYEYLSKPTISPEMIKKYMKSTTSYCESYYELLRNLYEKKLASKESSKKIKVNKYLGPDYETIEDIRE